MPPKLVVCFVPALDERWVDPEHCPFIHAQLGGVPVVPLRAQPNTQLIPTLVTGTDVDQHKHWQMTLRPRKSRTLLQKGIDLLPNVVTTTAQCVRHRFDPSFDLPTVEPRRRRQFEMYRYKITRDDPNPNRFAQSFNGVPTLFSMLGDGSAYRPLLSLDQIQQTLPHTDPAAHDLTFLHLYGYDIYLHWHLDNPDALRDATRRVDRAVQALHQNCVAAGVPMLFFAEHGQEVVTGHVDILARLKHIGLDPDEFTYYCEAPCTRFWFHSDRAETMVRNALSDLNHVTLIDGDDMAGHHMPIRRADGFGELFAFTHAGHVFFPQDFYHPLVNRYMALTQSSNRTRRDNPVHRGYHGHLPHETCERGYMALLNPAAAVSPIHAGAQSFDEPANLIDITPTILSLLGRDIPAHIAGRPRTLTRQAQHHAA